MTEMQWVPILLTLGSALLGSYLGVKIAVAKLETHVALHSDEIEKLRDARVDHGERLQSHEVRLQYIERQEH